MGNQVENEQLKSELILPWAIVAIMLLMLAAYLIICHTLGAQLQQPIPESQRIVVRTVLYAVAIVTFPLTNLIRHIQIRLNQTMPLPQQTDNITTVAKSRYLVTIIVSMSLVEIVGVFGLVMFLLGDDFNTLYIFIGLSTLGLFLYRPKADEFSDVIEALTAKNE